MNGTYLIGLYKFRNMCFLLFNGNRSCHWSSVDNQDKLVGKGDFFIPGCFCIEKRFARFFVKGLVVNISTSGLVSHWSLPELLPL